MSIDKLFWDDGVAQNYLNIRIEALREYWDVVKYQKGEVPRCPECNAAVRQIDDGQTAGLACDGCGAQFFVERIGSIYYFIYYDYEKR